jgi:hypothetical protein
MVQGIARGPIIVGPAPVGMIPQVINQPAIQRPPLPLPTLNGQQQQRLNPQPLPPMRQ